MKRLLSLVLALAMAVTFTACSQSGPASSGAASDASSGGVSSEISSGTPSSGETSVDSSKLSEIVTTDKGDIRGYSSLSEDGSTIYTYRGIPYAEAPVGELRWTAAQEKTAWEGVLDCTEYRETCYQFGSGLLPNFAALPQSEDCLYLNVITPAETTEDALPVMVWFHGGALATGGGIEETYNLTDLPAQGCIVVTVNMRLGIFGLLASDALSEESAQNVSGNYMISDMIAALKWVQNNISAFGGNADNVTIFGESSGGSKVNTLLASPEAAGLFCKAITQSPATYTMELEDAQALGNEFLNALGVDSLEAARELPAETIIETANAMEFDYSFVVDHYYLNSTPQEAFASGDYNHVTLITGCNEGEITMPGKTYYSCPVETSASMTDNGDTVYVYFFNQVPANWSDLGGRAVHSMDLAYVFGDMDNGAGTFSGGPWGMNCMLYMSDCSPAEFIAPELGEGDKAVSEEMLAMWAQFAATGDPSIEGIEWTAWNAEEDNYLSITRMNGETTAMKNGFSTLLTD